MMISELEAVALRLFEERGFGQYVGKVFRIGHMGRAKDPEVIDRYLALTATYLDQHR